MKLTKRSVDALTWNGKATHIEYDDELTGFGVRVYESGLKSFVVSVHPKRGRRRRITVLGKMGELTVKQARDEAIQHLAAAARGVDLVAEQEKLRRAEENRVTFAEAAADYLRRASLPGRKATWKQDRQMLNKDVLPVLGKLLVEEVTRRDINRVLDRILARGAKFVANRTLAAIRVVLSHAVEQGWTESNPALGMKQPYREKPRQRFLTEEEILTFWRATEELRDLTGVGFRLMLLTGQRAVRETLGMRWDELDLEDPDNAWWSLPETRTKSGRANLVPLSRLAVENLRAVRQLGLLGPWVFPSMFKRIDGPITDASQPRRRMYDLCGFYFQLKDLRRTVATHLPRLGVSRFVVARILNHADATVTGRHYDRYEYAEEKKAALDQWGRHLERLINHDIQPTSAVHRIAA